MYELVLHLYYLVMSCGVKMNISSITNVNFTANDTDVKKLQYDKDTLIENRKITNLKTYLYKGSNGYNEIDQTNSKIFFDKDKLWAPNIFLKINLKK